MILNTLLIKLDKQLEAAAASFAVKLEKERDEENGKAMKKGYIID